MNYRGLFYAVMAMAIVSCGPKKEVAKESSSKRETTESVKKEAEKEQTATAQKKESSAAVAESAKNSVEQFSVKGVSFKMIRVSGGTFAMGASPEQGKFADATEKPLHKVTLNNYYMAQTEVTQALWQAVMGNNPSKYKGDDLPVESVSWNACQTFIKRLNTMTGKSFRLPTEAEWEYAARGGSASKKYMYSGSNDWTTVAIRDKYATAPTYRVASKEANELGIYDMTGNVSEWCEDWFGNYASGAQVAPKGPENGESRIYRGGSATMPETYYRVSARDGGKPDFWFYTVGLRLAMSE